MKFTLKSFIVFAAIASQWGCASFIETQHGVRFRTEEPPSSNAGVEEFPRGNGDQMWVVDPPVTIKLMRPVISETLFCGPIIPIPFIPWLPGIVRRLRAENRDNSEENVEVVLTFARAWRRGPPLEMDIRLDPKNVLLKVGAEEYSPSTFSYLVRQRELVPYGNGGYTFGGEVPDPHANRYGLHNGVFDVHISSEHDRATDIHFVFPLKYRDLASGTLVIKSVQTPMGEKRIPPVLLTNGRKLLFTYTALND